MMRKKKWNITYRVYTYEKLKNKVSFFGTDMYPLYIRVTHGISTLNFKSHIFHQLSEKKYQPGEIRVDADLYMAYIKNQEAELIDYIIRINSNDFSLKTFKACYLYFSKDLLDGIDKGFKQYLIGFLYNEGITSIPRAIEVLADSFRGEVVCAELKKILSAPMYEKMMAKSIAAAPPYIPIISFCKMKYTHRLPVFLIFHFLQEGFANEINAFFNTYYPEYNRNHPYKYLQEYVGRFSSCT